MRIYEDPGAGVFLLGREVTDLVGRHVCRLR